MNALARATRQVDNLLDTLTRGENIGDATLVDELRALRASVIDATTERPIDPFGEALSDDDVVEQADRELGAVLEVLHDACGGSLATDVPASTLCTILSLAERLHRVSCRHRGTLPAPARRIEA